MSLGARKEDKNVTTTFASVVLRKIRRGGASVYQKGRSSFESVFQGWPCNLVVQHLLGMHEALS